MEGGFSLLFFALVFSVVLSSAGNAFPRMIHQDLRWCLCIPQALPTTLTRLAVIFFLEFVGHIIEKATSR